ncbi:hypothetical protein CROQUDRAFT_224839 [Cronartium quercuum f. sp. fusiforme G11]|uniref:Cytochrome P450 n=1 Tax=Cronartium quercuum f. sp. fusiforme G11 TaxID=708437 RepID=A0A9P6T8H4_9BASI|nr:hypothetical protein CROQUDRAFT_224839 [Cronartium quercuum f. sp. fusiforme G11]
MSVISKVIFDFIKTLALIASVSLVYLLVRYRNRAIGTSTRKDPSFPEIPGIPIFGNLWSGIYHARRPLEYTTAIGLQHGPGWSFTFPGMRIIDISKPEWIEYVQKKNFSNFIKGALIHEVMGDVFGDGIFVTDGPQWKTTRQCTSRIFHMKSFKNIIVPSLHLGLQSLRETLQYKADQQLDVDFCSIFYKFTLESFVKMTFNQDLDLLKAERCPDIHSLSSSTIAFASAFDFSQNQLDWRFAIMNGWSILENKFSSLGNQMREACKTLDEFVYKLIDEREGEDKTEDPEARNDLLELFMRADDETGTSLKRHELKDAVLNMIIAGRDTTANITYENYKQYVWTQAVISEALRLHPSVAKNMKFAVNHDQIPNGPIIQPGEAVRWSDWQMGRDPRIWGDDCGEFKPERWIDSEGKLKQFGQFKFHAFNGGPRICLGMNLAMLEAVAVIVEILKNFDVEFAPGWLERVPKSNPVPGVKTPYPTPRYKPSLTHPMDQPMMIRPRGRKGAF